MGSRGGGIEVGDLDYGDDDSDWRNPEFLDIFKK